MDVIHYQVGGVEGEIVWAASEFFAELAGKTYPLGHMAAVEIAALPELSLTAKLLLSAVAGAIIQRLLDQGLSAAEIFAQGNFTVQPREEA